MEGDVPAELLEERDPVTDQDRQDRVPNLVGGATWLKEETGFPDVPVET